MVNMRVPSYKLESTNNSGDADALEEKCVAIYKLCRHNQTLEDDVYNIRQHQHESNPLRGDEIVGSLTTLR